MIVYEYAFHNFPSPPNTRCTRDAFKEGNRPQQTQVHMCYHFSLMPI